MNPTTGIAGCCARASSGHATAVLPTNAMNSRRLMASPAPRTTSGIKRISRFWIENCRSLIRKRAAPMSALGQKRTLTHIRPMSALPPKADISPLFNHLVGAGEQCWRNLQPQNSRCGQVDEEVELGRLNDRKVGRLLTVEDAARIDADQSKSFR